MEIYFKDCIDSINFTLHSINNGESVVDEIDSLEGRLYDSWHFTLNDQPSEINEFLLIAVRILRNKEEDEIKNNLSFLNEILTKLS